MNKSIIGVDIGGTTFSSALFSEKLETQRVSDKQSASNYLAIDSFLDALSEQINTLISGGKNIDLIGVGVSCPGPLDSKNGIILETPNIQILQNINLKKELQDRLDVEVHIENDANLFALGEWLSNSKDIKQVFSGITLGTGLGFGVIINGKIYSGAHGLAAEYAISPIDGGNWENKISIKAIRQIASKYFDDKHSSPKKIAQMAKEGDQDAIKVWNEFGENLGLALSHFINLIDPHKISVGGGISNAFNLFKGRMQETLNDHCPAYKEFDIEIFESKYKELSSQLGAAALVKGYHQRD